MCAKWALYGSRKYEWRVVRRTGNLHPQFLNEVRFEPRKSHTAKLRVSLFLLDHHFLPLWLSVKGYNILRVNKKYIKTKNKPCLYWLIFS